MFDPSEWVEIKNEEERIKKAVRFSEQVDDLVMMRWNWRVLFLKGLFFIIPTTLFFLYYNLVIKEFQSTDLIPTPKSNYLIDNNSIIDYVNELICNLRRFENYIDQVIKIDIRPSSHILSGIITH
jgi:hypothetical protein